MTTPTPDVQADLVAKIVSAAAGTAATATITVVSVAAFVDAQTFTLIDATGQAKVFELDDGGGPPLGAGHVAIGPITSPDARPPETQYADVIAAAINSVGAALRITASFVDNIVTLVQRDGGTAGNRAIGAMPSGLTASGFTGGAGGYNGLSFAADFPSDRVFEGGEESGGLAVASGTWVKFVSEVADDYDKDGAVRAHTFQVKRRADRSDDRDAKKARAAMTKLYDVLHKLGPWTGASTAAYLDLQCRTFPMILEDNYVVFDVVVVFDTPST
jgi:hypothetical protein